MPSRSVVCKAFLVSSILLALTIWMQKERHLNDLTRQIRQGRDHPLSEHSKNISRDIGPGWKHPEKLPVNSRTMRKVWSAKGLQDNIVFAKIEKCASSTVGGVSRRIASNHWDRCTYDGVRKSSPSRRQNIICKLFATHEPKPYMLKEVTNKTLRKNTFLFSNIRNPGARRLSFYFHVEVSRKKASTSEESILRYLKISYKRDFMAKWLGSHLQGCRGFITNSEDCVKDIVNEYDFIGTVEKLPESFVVMKILNNLSFSDILFVKDTKRHGSFDDQGYLIEPTIRTPAVDDYLLHHFEKKRFVDQILHEKVEEILENTIEAIGSNEFSRELGIYKRLLDAADQHCEGRVFPPFNKFGKSQKELSSKDCYWNDNGCGIQCMDEFVKTEAYETIIGGT